MGNASAAIRNPIRIKNEAVQRFYIPSIWTRLMAVLFDFGLLFFVLCLVFPSLRSELSRYIAGKEILFSWFSMAGFWGVGFLYEILFLKGIGATPGKLLFGLRVHNYADPHSALTWRPILVRILGFRITTLLGLLPYTIALFRTDRRHLCDLFAKTIVLQTTFKKKPGARWLIGSIFVLHSLMTLTLSSKSTKEMGYTAEGLQIKSPIQKIKRIRSGNNPLAI